ncbi:MAG: dihydrofolate reductase, partial [Acidobacteriaceae bacterium]|nr:dihydrofolate reductase [Acidobacteriaceae bacterium]
KVVLGLGISLDGYIARPDGSVDFLFMPKDYSMAPFLAPVDTAIMGRKTLEAGLRMTGGKFDNYGIKCYVMSRSQPSGDRDGYEITNHSPDALIGELRKSPGKNIWMMGGGELARDFLKADLIDAMEIGMVPTLIGDGIPLFPAGFPQREFTLTENKAYSKGLLVLKYERVRKKASSRK